MHGLLRYSALGVIDSPRTAHVVGGATLSMGILNSLIPSTPTEVAACIGGLLSIVLIIKHVVSGCGEWRERKQRMKKTAIEIQKLKEE